MRRCVAVLGGLVLSVSWVHAQAPILSSRTPKTRITVSFVNRLPDVSSEQVLSVPAFPEHGVKAVERLRYTIRLQNPTRSAGKFSVPAPLPAQWNARTPFDIRIRFANTPGAFSVTKEKRVQATFLLTGKPVEQQSRVVLMRAQLKGVIQPGSSDSQPVAVPENPAFSAQKSPLPEDAPPSTRALAAPIATPAVGGEAAGFELRESIALSQKLLQRTAAGWTLRLPSQPVGRTADAILLVQAPPAARVVQLRGEVQGQEASSFTVSAQYTEGFRIGFVPQKPDCMYHALAVFSLAYEDAHKTTRTASLVVRLVASSESTQSLLSPTKYYDRDLTLRRETQFIDVDDVLPSHLPATWLTAAWQGTSPWTYVKPWERGIELVSDFPEDADKRPHSRWKPLQHTGVVTVYRRPDGDLFQLQQIQTPIVVQYHPKPLGLFVAAHVNTTVNLVSGVPSWSARLGIAWQGSSANWLRARDKRALWRAGVETWVGASQEGISLISTRYAFWSRTAAVAVFGQLGGDLNNSHTASLFLQAGIGYGFLQTRYFQKDVAPPHNFYANAGLALQVRPWRRVPALSFDARALLGMFVQSALWNLEIPVGVGIEL